MTYSDGPYSKSSAAGSAWPWGHPGKLECPCGPELQPCPLEWSEDELNDHIDARIREDADFAADWYLAKYEADGTFEKLRRRR